MQEKDEWDTESDEDEDEDALEEEDGDEKVAVLICCGDVNVL